MISRRTLYTFAAFVVLEATIVTSSPLAARAPALECCQSTIDPLEPLGITILKDLGLENLVPIGVIGVDCVTPSLATVLNGQCVLTNVLSCQIPDVTVPIIGGTFSLGCQPNPLSSLPL